MNRANLKHLSLIVLIFLSDITVTNATVFVAELKNFLVPPVVIRNKQSLPLKILMGMKEGDTIIVKEKNGEIKLLADDHSIIVITKSNSPYKITGFNNSKSKWDNIVKWWYAVSTTTRRARTTRTTTKEETEISPVTELSKKDIILLEKDIIFLEKDITSATKYSEEDLSPDIKALSLLGFNSKSNLITINRNNVYFFWKDGIAPTYQAQIYDANKQLVFKAQSSHNFISIPSKTFKVGHEYSIKICCRFLSEMNSELLEQDLMSEQYFAIIKAEQLPIHITHLNSLALSEKAKARLAAESLALLPKWKFQALQLSETYHLDKLKQKLLYKN